MRAAYQSIEDVDLKVMPLSEGQLVAMP